MGKSKNTNIICIAIVIAMLFLTIAFINGEALGVQAVKSAMPYEKLFDTSKIHEINIIAEKTEWDNMIANATKEEYIQASVVIDGEKVSSIGIRPKGNSSLSSIANSDSDRYSFKIEFDHYIKGRSYYGLDKLALNNIAQDNTYLKDYISYQMMNEIGANAPLSSFIYIKVNGEDWGLYLAVEAVEDSFAERVYGNNSDTNIYKPDTMDMNQGGGFNAAGERPADGGNFDGEMPAFGGDMPDFEVMTEEERQEFMQNMNPERDMPNMNGRQNGGGFGGMGGGATSLTYTDDEFESYSAIFDNSAFKITDEDKTRLISSLKSLNESENIEEIVDVDEVIRYFVVHNFVLNSDSYTGNIVHNYYLGEVDGKLSMIAWDYNLAFGGMGAMGGGMGGFGNNTQTETSVNQATSLVNYPIDSPMLSGAVEDKPMIAWIFADEKYTQKYHEVFAEYMEYFNSGAFAQMFDNAVNLIKSYVEKDPSAFCTYEEFIKASDNLREFCLLRAESVTKQLNGTIASTNDGQSSSNNANFVDASAIDISSMGSNNMGFNRARGDFGDMPGRNRGRQQNTEQSEQPKETTDLAPSTTEKQETTESKSSSEDTTKTQIEPETMPSVPQRDGELPNGGFAPPEGQSMPDFGVPQNRPPNGENMPQLDVNNDGI